MKPIVEKDKPPIFMFDIFTMNYLESASKQFQYYKKPGDQAMAQLDDQSLSWSPNEESNSIATIVKHMSGKWYISPKK